MLVSQAESLRIPRTEGEKSSQAPTISHSRQTANDPQFQDKVSAKVCELCSVSSAVNSLNCLSYLYSSDLP